ncbi:pola1, partial [Symbiodinium necroappetens]
STAVKQAIEHVWSVYRRRQWLEEQISAAEKAASRNDLGHLLSVEQEFHEIHHYFQQAFSSPHEYRIPETDVLLSFTEICEAVRQLKPGKAVPEASLPADIWLLQPEGVAKLSAQVFQRSHARLVVGRRICGHWDYRRVEGLKKHINGGCPARVGVAFEERRPLFATSAFCSMLAESWRRLMHQTEWQHATAAADRINSLGLDLRLRGNFFLKMTDTEMTEETRATLAQTEIDLVFGQPKNKPEKEQDQSWAEQAKDWKEDGLDSDRPSKWGKKDGGKGAWRPWNSGSGSNPKRQWEPSSKNQENRASLDPQVQAFLTTVTRAVLRHEADLTLLRADTSYVLFIDISEHSCLQRVKDAASHWQELFTAGTVSMALKTALLGGIVKDLKEKLEEAYMNLDFCEWKPRWNQSRLGLGTALPLAKLCNPAGMNLCYANSCMQALFWLRELAGPVLQLASSAQAPADLRNNRDVVLACISHDAACLAHAPEALRSERSFLLDAVQRHLRALEFAGGFREDTESRKRSER